MWVHRVLLQCKMFPSLSNTELIDNGIYRNQPAYSSHQLGDVLVQDEDEESLREVAEHCASESKGAVAKPEEQRAKFGIIYWEEGAGFAQ